MRKILLLLSVVAVLVVGGCSGDNGKQLFETAQFEEKQHNLEHAKQLYDELAKKYPQSEFGQKAAERLKTLK